MHNLSFLHRVSYAFLCLCLGGSQLGAIPATGTEVWTPIHSETCQSAQPPHFLVVAGGGSPASNEIALEKNVLYFQRTLQTFGYNPASAHTFFANGNDGNATIRYIDDRGQQQFKSPEIPHLQGAATLQNLDLWFAQSSTRNSTRPFFFYFTGHGLPDTFLLWEDEPLTVQEFATQLDRLPQNTPIVTMMAQCFSGSFADSIYEGGDRTKPVALQTRCGFFATVATRPSVGCTPLVNEADYQDYSSSFFAGLSGVDRVGNPVPSADYNADDRISYAEAHAFAKVDEETIDWPISTSESWLQNRASNSDLDRILTEPIANLLSTARPEQRYVVQSLMQKENFNFDRQLSFLRNLDRLSESQVNSGVGESYLIRLQMELINIGMERKIRASQDKQAIATLDRLLNCEAGSWQ